MRRIAEAIPIALVDDYVGMVAQRILRYVAVEVDSAAAILHKDIKLFAWRTRNILEGYLLLQFNLLLPKNAEIFCAQRIADEMTILEGILGLNPALTGDDITLIKGRVDKCKAVLKKHGYTKANPLRVDKLAEAVGMKDDYSAFYKLYSKYVHPSSWVIMADVDEYDNIHYWEVFILNAQLYSSLCSGAGEELLISRGSNLQ